MVGPWARTSDEQFERHLDESYGLRNVKPEWISTHRTLRQNALVRTLCDSEIREVSNGSLPWRVQDAHGVLLGTKVLVQIDKVINVGAPDPKAPSPRLLQFAFSDGATSFIGIELDSAKSSFSSNTAPGTKLTLLPTVLVRRGRVLFTYEDYQLVGAPQGRARTFGNGEAMQTSSGHTGNGQSAGPNMGGASRDPSINPVATNITNVGGIAAIPEESDDGEDVDGLWSNGPTVRGRNPAPMRQGISRPSPMRSSGTGGTTAAAQQRPIQRERPSRVSEANPSRANTSAAPQRRDRAMTGARGSNSTEQEAIPAAAQRSTARNANAVPMDVDIDLTIAQPTEEVTEIPSSPEVMEVSSPKQSELAPEPEGMNITNPISPRIARLKELTDSAHKMSSRPQLCRLYSLKVGKKADHQLMRGSVASTLVDDGTAVRIVEVSDELLDNLRNSCPPSTEMLSQGAEQSNRRYLRALYGFVNMEFRDNNLVATQCAPKPITNMMLSEYLDDVSARFTRYLTS